MPFHFAANHFLPAPPFHLSRYLKYFAREMKCRFKILHSTYFKVPIILQIRGNLKSYRPPLLFTFKTLAQENYFSFAFIKWRSSLMNPSANKTTPAPLSFLGPLATCHFLIDHMSFKR